MDNFQDFVASVIRQLTEEQISKQPSLKRVSNWLLSALYHIFSAGIFNLAEIPPYEEPPSLQDERFVQYIQDVSIQLQQKYEKEFEEHKADKEYINALINTALNHIKQHFPFQS